MHFALVVENPGHTDPANLALWQSRLRSLYMIASAERGAATEPSQPHDTNSQTLAITSIACASTPTNLHPSWTSTDVCSISL